ncbi:hypothetical protein H2199_000579 [Coniosporium tulheliwenetii]|uniref:Uncharacterized protein n=1 Tax=Coniosporium tulheliwenetii TaxID=3383036 RepID=A0ACC2ZQF6_9PEZI|nr:hypothetical protein H2199_000579 [Cladosporium sp. JES 115]
MRIAQIAPLEEAIPPKLYGGTERIVSNLTEALVAAGHDVTLFASGDSQTSAKLEACWPESLRLNFTFHSKALPNVLLMERVLRRAREFDVLHFHDEFYHNLLIDRLFIPSVTTIHGSLIPAEMRLFFGTFCDQALVSISKNQRLPLPHANWVSTVYHGVPEDLLTPIPDVQPSYLAFLGRISPEKRVDRAVRIAEAAGMRLKVAAKIDGVDRDYYEKEIEWMMALPHVEYVGEICDAEKSEFLGNAVALLFPIDWQEPFGLVMIEAMACGTPIIAFNHGSVPEVVDEGLTGFVVHDEAAAVEAVKRVGTLSRATIRKVFEQRFSARTMAAGYIETYEKLLKQKREADMQKSRRVTNSMDKRTASNRSIEGLVQRHFDLRPVDDVAI